MPNYWLGIMAVAFAAAMALWIVIVFRAGRNVPRRQQPESGPHREVMGGVFEAREGGRQVMPDPRAPLAHDTGKTTSGAAVSDDDGGGQVRGFDSAIRGVPPR